MFAFCSFSSVVVSPTAEPTLADLALRTHESRSSASCSATTIIGASNTTRVIVFVECPLNGKLEEKVAISLRVSHRSHDTINKAS
ncbi:hypothetical protein CVT26_001449 [Gymnopilus dilepis]|uniref:Uncharacterized protein n=1 Tax=Gymnopilus dilepis TaxID=231916 RepID=A0A409YLX3_9AGAR|nr:hypothetical protein CVT26_001449 [Gymnopilus dilepis]